MIRIYGDFLVDNAFVSVYQNVKFTGIATELSGI